MKRPESNATLMDQDESTMTQVTPELLGFGPADKPDSWFKQLGDAEVRFAILHTISELEQTERLQREIFGTSELDTLAGNGMLLCEETGGFVLGAFVDGELAGFLTSYGGWVDHTPRLASDMMIVDSTVQSRGIGTELKKLQYALAAARGFTMISWTVDPLRAANARLNFEKLGAYCRTYAVDKYGSGYGTGLYGGMPTDRLYMSWETGSHEVAERLLGHRQPTSRAAIAALPAFDPAAPMAAAVTVAIPADIDALIPAKLPLALEWRMRVREKLIAAFAAGYAITGAVPAVPEGDATLVLTQRKERSA